MHSIMGATNWLLKTCIVVTLALILAACGYSLRGSEQANTTLSQIFLTASNPSDSLVAELISALEALSVDVLINNDGAYQSDARITLSIGNERLDRRAVFRRD